MFIMSSSDLDGWKKKQLKAKAEKSALNSVFFGVSCIKNQHCSCVPEHKQCVRGVSCIYRFYHTNWKDVFRRRSERLPTRKFVFLNRAKEKKMKAAKFKSQALIMGVEALNWTTSSTQGRHQHCTLNSEGETITRRKSYSTCPSPLTLPFQHLASESEC